MYALAVVSCVKKYKMIQYLSIVTLNHQNGEEKMPAYKKKITRPLEYSELDSKILPLPEDKQALIRLLFFSGCRVSEALALTSNDISCTENFIYVNFFRLKGSKQTDPQRVPRHPLEFICSQDGRIFPFTRVTAYRWVKKAFADLYPHYFRLNRFTKSLENFGASTVVNTYGISLVALQHYIGKVEGKKVGEALLEELG